MLRNRKLVFLGVGIINTLLDFGFYSLLTLTVFRDGQHIALAGVVSGTFALACAFTTHSLITWRGRQVDKQTAVRFVVFTGFGMWVIRPLLLTLFIKFSLLYTAAHSVSNWLSLPFSYQFIANTGAFGFMVILVLLYNYYTYDRFVFKHGVPDRTEPENHSAS